MTREPSEITAGLVLFVAGDSPRSKRAENNLRAACRVSETFGTGTDLSIEVIDVLEEPALAEVYQVLATPLVVRRDPERPRRAIGDFTDHDRLAAALDLPFPDQNDQEARA